MSHNGPAPALVSGSPDKTKLDGIEELADVTDATNVNAAGAVMESDFNAQTVLVAVSDNTPVATTVADSQFVGRPAGGDVGVVTAAQARAILNVEDGADVTDAANVDAAGAVMNSDYDANSILAATSDNTPVVLTVGEQTVVGRITAGAIAALTPAQVRTLLNVAEAGSSAAFPDPDAYLILQSEQSSGATIFRDGSGRGHTISAFGGITHSTIQAKFGSTSIRFDGSNDYLQTPVSADFDTAAPWTAECWVWPPAPLGSSGPLINLGNSTLSPQLIAGADTPTRWTTRFRSTAGGNPIIFQPDLALTASAWNHVAVSNDGTTLRVFRGGTLIDSYALAGQTIYQDSDRITFGSQQDGFGNWFGVGYMEDFVWTRRCKYTASFTAPTRQSQANVATPDSSGLMSAADEIAVDAIIAENIDGSVPIDILSGLPSSGTWTKTMETDGPRVTRTAAAAVEEYWIQVQTSVVRAAANKGMKALSIIGNYSVGTAALNDVRFELYRVTIVGDNAAPTRALIAGDQNTHYDSAHDSTAERGDATGAPENHGFTMAIPVGSQAYLLTGEQLCLRIVVDGTATGVFRLKACKMDYAMTLVDAS